MGGAFADPGAADQENRRQQRDEGTDRRQPGPEEQGPSLVQSEQALRHLAGRDVQHRDRGLRVELGVASALADRLLQEPARPAEVSGLVDGDALLVGGPKSGSDCEEHGRHGDRPRTEAASAGRL